MSNVTTGRSGRGIVIAVAVAGSLAGVVGAAFFHFVSRPGIEQQRTATKPIVKSSAAAETGERIVAAPAALSLPQPKDSSEDGEHCERKPSDPPLQAETRQHDFEQKIQFELSEHEGRLTSHAQEPIDKAWAADMEAKLSSSLFGLQGPLEPGKVDCRSASCVIDVSWPSREEAKAGIDGVIRRAGTQAPCTQHVVFPPAVDGSPRYQTKLYFDCTEARFGEPG